jgi:HEPN domain-containing protein
MSKAAPHEPWLRKAGNDFKTVEVLIREAPGLTAAICFHSQQCAEKLIKTLLVIEGKRPPYVHDLRKLFEKVKDFRLSEEAIEYLDFLSDYAVAARYPDCEPDQIEAQKAFEAISSIRSELNKQIEKSV